MNNNRLITKILQTVNIFSQLGIQIASLFNRRHVEELASSMVLTTLVYLTWQWVIWNCFLSHTAEVSQHPEYVPSFINKFCSSSLIDLISRLT